MHPWVAAIARDAPSWSSRAIANLRRGARAIADPGRDALISWLGNARAPRPTRVAAYQALLALEFAIDPDAALAVGERWLPSLDGAPAAVRALIGWYHRAHAIARPAELATAIGGDARADELARWWRDGLPLSARRPRARPAGARRVMYVVASSRPYHPAGYAARTQALGAALVRRGWDLHVVARPGYPNDRWDHPRWALAPAQLTVDGLPHHFAPDRRRLRYARDLEAYHRDAADTLEAQCRALAPAVIHAASNYNVGLAAIEVGRRLGIPVVYEVRGLWHVSKAAARPRYLGSDHFRMIERLEAQAAAAADHAFAITSGVRDALVAAGADAARISLLPNAADLDAFAPAAPDPELRARLGPPGATVIGYVGSLNDYEGVDDLIAAVAAVRATGRAAHLVVVGDGGQRSALVAQARGFGLDDAVAFTGRVPPAAVARYYAAIDLVVVPRKPTLVTELVSPLKPFEAMAMARAVVVSDVAALRDLVTDGATGRWFARGDRADLARVLCELCDDAAQRARLGAAARAWVSAARSWDALAAEVEGVYRRLGV